MSSSVVPAPKVMATLVGLTVANLGLSLLGGGPEPIVALDVEPGDTMPSVKADQSPCRVLVAFQSTCPFCALAAERERKLAEILPTTWVGSTLDDGASDYARRVHPDATVEISDNLYAELRVRAVPAAVLVDQDGVVRQAWPYQGTDDAESLAEKCVSPLS